jgi:hypothetical protein
MVKAIVKPGRTPGPIAVARASPEDLEVPMTDLTPETRPTRRIDWPSAAMALATCLALAGTGWLRFGPPSRAEPPKVGSSPPPLRLLDPVEAEPVVLLGLRGKVVWLTFWSAGSPSTRADLRALDEIWKQFKSRPHFALAAAALEWDRPDQVRAAVQGAGVTVPIYLATPETRRAYGVDKTPLHILLDEDGHVLAIASGTGTLARLTELAEQRLDLLEPPRHGRFAFGRLATEVAENTEN